MQLRLNPIRLLLLLAVLAGAARFAERGPWLGRLDSHDFAAIYTGSRAWLLGKNPFDHAVLSRVWREAGGPADRAPNRAQTPAVLPPTIFPPLAPLAALRWRAAEWCWCAVNLLACGLLLECTRRMARFAWSEPRMLLLTALALTLKPISSSVKVGQPSLVVTALAAWAILAGTGSGGLLHALALAIKAPLAAAFALPDLIGLRWRKLAVAAALLAAIGAVGVARLGSPQQWWPDWRANLESGAGPGGVNDASRANPARNQIVNLQVLVFDFVQSRAMVNAICVAVALAVALPALLRLRERPTGPALLLPLSVALIAELLAFYHRLYDAPGLIFPLAWALLPTTRNWQRWPALALLAVFIVPGSAPRTAGFLGPLSMWNEFVLPREAWALLLLGAWLAACQWAELGGRDSDLQAG